MTPLSSLAAAAQVLLDQGFEVIPCIPDTKKALYPGWQQRDPAAQVQQALDEGKPFNLAVRCGGRAGLVVIDCEDEATYRNAVDWISFMGVESYPIVRTASGMGYHIWLHCPNIPQHLPSYTDLSPDFGKGEVRSSSGAYVMAPPSYAWSDHGQCFGTYVFETPDEMFGEMQSVDWDEVIRPLMGARPQIAASSVEEGLPIPLLHQPAPRFVHELLASLSTAPTGQPIPYPGAPARRSDYASRSHAEQAVITILLLCGWSKSEIQDLLERAQSGHYRDYQAERKHQAYFERSYQRAVTLLVNTPDRQPILAAYWWAASSAWPLASGLARLVYQHILRTAWKDARLDPVVPYPSLRAATGASQGGLYGALGKLEEAGLIRRLPAGPECGDWDRLQILLDAEKTNKSHEGGCYTKSRHVFDVPQIAGGSYTAGYVYCVLSDEPQSIKALAVQVGADRGTVSACLKALEEIGLACQMHRYGWVAGDAQFEDLVAQQDAVPAEQEMRQAVAAFEQIALPGLSVGRDDAIGAYIDAMNHYYDYGLKRQSLGKKWQVKLKELEQLLGVLYLGGEIDTPSPRQYIFWVARRYRLVAAECGWPLVWVNVVVSSKELRRYAREMKPLVGYGVRAFGVEFAVL